MGIKNLLTFLSNFPSTFEEKEIDSYKGKKIAIDISLLLYQIIISTRNSGSDIINENGISITHIVGLFNRTFMLLEKGIIPIYVFDGKPSELKSSILLRRKNNRKNAIAKLNNCNDELDKIKYFKRSSSITKEQYMECKELLHFMGVSYIESNTEADIVLANLCKNNIVHGVYSDDMDILALGSPKLIKNLFSYKKNPIELNLEKILSELKLSYSEFIELCLLFGCDYCKRITNIKSLELYNIYKQYKNIAQTIYKLNNLGYYVKNNNNYNLIKTQFSNDYNNYNIIYNKPNYNMLLNFLINKHGLIRYKIINKINKYKSFFNL
jgi:flap endonuclease-1